MSLESAAIAALSAVVTALCYLFSLVWKRSQECEQWRKEREPIISDLTEKVGALTVLARLVHGCKVQGCNFAGNIETLSLTIKKTSTRP